MADGRQVVADVNQIAPFSPADIAALAKDPDSARAFTPWSEAPSCAVLCDAGGSADEVVSASGWLRALPCPVIGLGGAGSGLADACDVVVATEAEAAPLLQNIASTPLAAALFVQLLRSVEGLPLAAALHAESLAYATLQAGPEYARWLDAQAPRRHSSAPEQEPAVLVEQQGSRVHLQLNRPQRGNAMSVEMRDALLDALRALLADPEQPEVYLSGRGNCFSTGGDLDEFGTVPDAVTGHIVRGMALPGRALAACAARACVVVHGACIGSGIEFPAFAGHITARADAYFQLPELRFGLIPGAGGCVSIPRRIGRQRTAWMVLSGEAIDAATALSWGLVDAVE